MCTWSYIPACQLLFMGKYSLETSLIPESKNPNGSQFRPPVSDVRLTTNFLNARGAIEAEPWAWCFVDRHSPVGQWFFFRKGYISTVRQRVCQSRVPTHTLCTTITNTTVVSYLQLFTTHSHEDQHPMDDRLRPLRHCILLAQ